MDLSNTTKHDVPVNALVARAQLELERLGYSVSWRQVYHATWRQFLAFTEDHGGADQAYSDDLGARFVEASRPAPDEDLGEGEHWRPHVVYGIKVLGDCNRHGRIEPFHTDLLKAALSPSMKTVLREYRRYIRDKRHLQPRALLDRTRDAARLLHFLDSRKVQRLQDLQSGDLTAFIASQSHLKRNTLSKLISGVRVFLKFLAAEGTLRKDLSNSLPTVRVPADAGIPSVWDGEALVKVLRAVDRSSPRGKRDYAMLLLACRLGLRAGDIRALTLDQIDWDNSAVNLTQAKTGIPLQLPLSEEVGEALIDYLRSGRPPTNHREVFLGVNAPFQPFGESNHMYNILIHWRRVAGIKSNRRKRTGFHSLRHTLATRLLREETPIHVISEILGHAKTATTLIYAKADTEMLRGVALNTEETPDVE